MKQNTLNENNSDVSKNTKADEKRRNNYFFYDEPEVTSQVDDIERECVEYVRTKKSSSFNNPLEFWKCNNMKPTSVSTATTQIPPE